MTTGIGNAGAAQAAVLTGQQKLQSRDDEKENSTREAHNSFTFTSTGVGSLRIRVPVVFDCKFIEEPHITSGVFMARGVLESMYHFPQTTIGVYSWQKLLQQPLPVAPGDPPAALSPNSYDFVNNPDDKAPTFYLGAYLFIRVACDPQPGVKPLAVERSPANPILHHHITFTGIAMKILADPITATADDPTVPPKSTGLDGGTTP